MRIDLDLIVEYNCGCKECVRSGFDLPKEYCNADRTPENDKKLIDYLLSEYDIDRLCCHKPHSRYTDHRFSRIVEVL